MPKGHPTTPEACRQSLLDAVEELGHSPSRPEYQQVDVGVSSSAIEQCLGDGSWNEAKRSVGLETNGIGGKLSVDEQYFSDIGDPETAYWLGFLYGDGSVYDPGVGSPVVKLEIQSSDGDHLEMFRDSISSDHAISRHYNTVSICISNQQIADDLASHGFTANKTFSDSIPDLTDDRLRVAFMRGLFDADGHVGEFGRFNVTGSSERRFERLSEWLPVDTYIQDRGDRVFTLRVGGVDRLTELYCWLYPSGEETEPKLGRKYEDVRRYRD
jgi:hypothetical protein